jgi:two-component system, NtrC family, sensor histidine kinase KinB
MMVAKIDNSRASLELLYEISRELSSTLDLRTVLTRMLFHSVSNVGAERGSFIVVDDALNPVDAAIVIGDQVIPNTAQRLQGTLDQGLAGWVVRHREAAWLPDTSLDERWVQREDDLQSSEGGKSAICVPVLAREKLVGVMTIVHPLRGFLTHEHLALLELIAAQAGNAIFNARLYDSVQLLNQRNRELFDDHIDPILLTNWQGMILDVNRCALRTVGCEQGILLQRPIEEFIEIRQDLLGDGFRNLLDGETVSYETELKSISGSNLPVEVYVRKVNLVSEYAIQWMLRDITERKALDSMREDLAAMIYHDLRSPLANIVSSLDMLEAMIPPDAAPSLEPLFSIASRSIDRMQRLINSLLDINRLEAGQTITSQKSVDPQTLVNEAVDAILPITNSKKQELNVEAAPELPMIWVDSDMIRRVLINLMENAAKFTPMNGVITLGVNVEDSNVHFWVEDNGGGIPLEARQQIFEKFVRLQADRYPRGLGLGLAFCRLAVQAHGGKIWVDSEVGKGSNFHFLLPLAKS